MKPAPHPVDSGRHQRCITNIARLVALPGQWGRLEPAQIADELIDCLFTMLQPDFAHLRLSAMADDAALEVTRLSHRTSSVASWGELEPLLSPWRAAAVQDCPGSLRLLDNEFRVRSLRLGLSGEAGLLIVGTRRSDFPHQTEELLLTVAANQATIGLQMASQLCDVGRSGSGQHARILALRQIAGSLAHDLSQPLAGIMTNAGTGLRMLSADPPNVEGARETARRTIRDTKRASDIIGRLRALCDSRPATSEIVDPEAAMQPAPSPAAEMARGR